jgi:mannose/fructose-specific phosphotransferase system component IIA
MRCANTIATSTSEPMINFLIVTHGEFGAYLIEAAEAIVGAQAEGVRAISISPRHSIDEIRDALTMAIRELEGPDGLIVAADMPGGTPMNVALPLLKDLPNVQMVSGLNLYMLVGAFTRRASGTLEEVTRRMVEDGKKSVHDLKQLLEAQRARAK